MSELKLLEQIFFRRPRILNQLHRVWLVQATSQTNEAELAALAKHASGKLRGLEIGTYQGVSAARIAGAMAPQGKLFCVDPWPPVNGRPNPCLQICERHLSRSATMDRIVFVHGLSSEMRGQIPAELDFAFIDGDHSWTGIETDWDIVCERIRPGGIVCLHDVVVPQGQPWRLDSSRYFDEVIVNDDRFVVVEIVHSLAVLRREGAN